MATVFIRNGHLLFLAIAVLVVAGLSAFGNLPRIEDPRMTLRNGVIVTALPGASATRVEALVTEKIENRLEELGEIKRVDSTSRTGISLITFELQDSITDDTNEAALSKIRDKLDDVQRELPPNASKPDLDDKRGAVAFSQVVALQWKADQPPQLGILNRYAQELADRLRNLPGTEWVQFYGEPREEITVTLDPAEMSALGISAADVAARLAAADVKNPAGQLRTDQRDLILEVVGELDSVQRIAAVPIVDDGAGRVVKIADLASVKRQWRQPADEIALANGRRAVMIGTRTDRTVRVDQWAEAANALVAEFANELDDGVAVDVVFDQSDYTVKRLADLGNNLLAGALVVMLVVLIGMGWRAALIVGAALPLAAAATLFGLTFFGQQIHQMTIFGMIIAIGLLIDNAIVVTDEVRKHLAAGEERVAAVNAGGSAPVCAAVRIDAYDGTRLYAGVSSERKYRRLHRSDCAQCRARIALFVRYFDDTDRGPGRALRQARLGRRSAAMVARWSNVAACGPLLPADAHRSRAQASARSGHVPDFAGAGIFAARYDRYGVFSACRS